MTRSELNKALRNVRAHARRGDDESAHSAADALHQDVLEAIANGDCDDPVYFAQQAMRTETLNFSRWYS